MLEHRWAGAMAVVMGGKIYVYGGGNGKELLSSVECFDPVMMRWDAVPPMGQRRHGATVSVMAGHIYICGGWADQVPLNTAERFNPVTLEWEDLPVMLEC